MEQRIILSPDTFLWQKGKTALLYNASNGHYFQFSTANEQIDRFCEQMRDSNNLYSVVINTEYADNELIGFLNNVEKLKLGRIVSKDTKAFSLPPEVRVLNNVERMKEDGMEHFGVLSFLSDITIYIGGHHPKNKWFQQIEYPISSDEKISLQNLFLFISEKNLPRKTSIKWVVSERQDNYIPLIAKSRAQSQSGDTFVFSLESFVRNADSYELLFKLGYHTSLVLSPDDIRKVFSDQTTRETITRNSPSDLKLMIDQEETLSMAEEIADTLSINNTSFIPVWNDNLAFLSQKVFVNKEEILSSLSSKRKIYIRQQININYWGRLTIMPNGLVYSDVNSTPLGSMSKPIINLIQDELYNNISWRRVRSFGRCEQCLYQWLCPPPSPIESLSHMTICNDVHDGIVV